MKESICFIIPPSIFLLDERVFPSLGVLKVASSLEERGWLVEVLDLSGYSNYEEITKLHVSNSKSKIFGVTTTTPQMPAATNVVKAIRETNKNAKIIIGGPHPTLVAAAMKSEKKAQIKGRAHRAFEQLVEIFDVIVAGDGEDAVFEAIALAKKGEGFVDADDPKSPFFLSNTRLEQTPWPARHLIDLDTYDYQIDKRSATSLIAQLGCPFKCGFCGGRMSPMLRRIRMRSTADIVAEIEHIYKMYGHTGFMFYDDELNVNKKLIELMDSISDLQSRLGVDFSLRGFTKAELFTDDQAIAMRRAGFSQLLTGFESGSPRILKNIDKKASRDDNTRCVEIAKRHGLKVKALMSIGHPGESHETIDETMDWLLEVAPDDFDCTIITTYPGSPYYDKAVEMKPGIWTYTHEKNGDRLHAVEIDYNETADYYKGDPDLDGGYQAYVFTDYITRDELVTERDNVEREARKKLSIPFNRSMPSVNYEHTIGQGPLPSDILRSSTNSESKRRICLNVIK